MSTSAALEEIGATSADIPPQQSAAQVGRVVQPHHRHIPSLDGLRGVAALNVMFAHGYWYIVLLQQDQAADNAFARFMGSGAGVGMTLFFVLSGFVIHYNYCRTVPASTSGKIDFFIARFARLYPLF